MAVERGASQPDAQLSLNEVGINEVVAQPADPPSQRECSSLPGGAQQTTNMQERLTRTTASMMWAAWADALGFISELTDAEGLKRRLAGNSFDQPVTWRRRIGGRFGVQAVLPAGCYSDDTQLRLATGRAISGHGFDVEAFARVELTVWPTYALGGGHASRAAAAGMSKSRARWFANFYDGWHNSGGNGVAMRIQPHVWAAADLTGDQWLEDVLVNGIVTHGHPRGLIGGALAGAALAFALREGRRPTLEDWDGLLGSIEHGDSVLNRRAELASIWRPMWEQTTQMTFAEAWRSTVDECRKLCALVRPHASELARSTSGDTAEMDRVWAALLQTLGLFDDATRGSGTSTVVASLVLVAAFNDPAQASRCAARAVGSDTDTIATMAAAVIGAAADPAANDAPPVLDEQYLRDEAARLCAVALDEPTSVYPYPDLLHWTPPQSQLDGVGLVNGDLALAGMGALTPIAEPIVARDAYWQWVRTSFGPTMLVKRRPKPRALTSANGPGHRDETTSADPADVTAPRPAVDAAGPSRDAPNNVLDETETSHDTEDVTLAEPTTSHLVSRTAKVNVDQMLDWVRRRNYDEQAVGYAVTRISDIGTVEQLIAFVTVLRERVSNRNRDQR